VAPVPVRPVAGIVVAADSPAGRASDAVNDLTRHLPDPGAPETCPTCADRYWPCTFLDDAAGRMNAAGLKVGDFVPLELHRRLWPPASTREQPERTAEPPGEERPGG